jgi:hypothetical protein
MTQDPRTAELAAWRDDLRARIARAQLIYELHDTEFDFGELADEVAAFRRVCACLAWRDGDLIK